MGGRSMTIIMDEKAWMESVKSKLYGINIKKIESEDEITIEMLEECLQTSAKLVKLYGKKYLPIFERMCHEVENWKRDEDLINKAIRIAEANESATQNVTQIDTH